VSSSPLGLYGVLVPGLPIVVHKSSALLSALSIVIRLSALSPNCRPGQIRTNCSIYVSQKNQRKDGSGGREIQEALSLTVRSQRNHPSRPVTPFVSRRAGSSHSGFPCGPPSAATTAAAPCSPIQPARVTTFAGSRCRIHWSLYRSSQQTGANPRPLGECHDNSFLASSHHTVPELVSRERYVLRRSRSWMLLEKNSSPRLSR